MAERKYTLFSRGQKVVSSDNLLWLEEGLSEFESTRSTYIRFNETGVNHYAKIQDQIHLALQKVNLL